MFKILSLSVAGIGLMEIVTEPDFENGIDCSSFVREVQLMMRQLQVCLGSFRGMYTLNPPILQRKLSKSCFFCDTHNFRISCSLKIGYYFCGLRGIIISICDTWARCLDDIKANL